MNKYNYENEFKYKIFKENETKKENLNEIIEKLRILIKNKSILINKKINVITFYKYYSNDNNKIEIYFRLEKNNVILIEQKKLRNGYDYFYYNSLFDIEKILKEYCNSKDLKELNNNIDKYLKELTEIL